MAQRITGLYKLVTVPAIYRGLMFALGADRAMVRYAEILDARPGMKMLDVGCGPANIFPYLPPLDYTGIDLNEKHIDFARQRFGDRARFMVGNAADLGLGNSSFDLINVSGLLHHLSDSDAIGLFRSLKPLLAHGGRIVTLDPVWLPRQRMAAALANRIDSGLNIRSPENYLALPEGFEVQSRMLNDLLRIPYDHFVMIAR